MSSVRPLRIVISLLALCSPAAAVAKWPLMRSRPGVSSVTMNSVGKVASVVEAGVGLDQQIKEGKALSAAFKHAALDLPIDSPTRQLFQSFEVCGTCHKFERFGEAHDGGYLTCMDHLEDGHIKAAYSFGVEHHDKFSSDVVNALHVPVNQFDCTVTEAPEGCSDCHFFEKCIRGSNSDGGEFEGRSWDLEEIFFNTGMDDAPERSLLLKMDIEAAEWHVLNDEPEESKNLKKFQQIVIEFHWLHTTERHPEFLAAMRKLFSAGFSVVHIHGNNWAGEVQADEFHIPDVIEVTFEANAHAREECNSKQEFLPLDAPNNVAAPELRAANLPK